MTKKTGMFARVKAHRSGRGNNLKMTIPISVREVLGIEAGNYLIVTVKDGKMVVEKET